MQGHGPTIAGPCLPYCGGGGVAPPPIKQVLGLVRTASKMGNIPSLGLGAGAGKWSVGTGPKLGFRASGVLKPDQNLTKPH